MSPSRLRDHASFYLSQLRSRAHYQVWRGKRTTQRPWLISLDLDGTLLAPDGTLTAYGADTIRKLLQAGHHVVLNTARNLGQTRAVVKGLLETLAEEELIRLHYVTLHSTECWLGSGEFFSPLKEEDLLDRTDLREAQNIVNQLLKDNGHHIKVAFIVDGGSEASQRMGEVGAHYAYSTDFGIPDIEYTTPDKISASIPKFMKVFVCPQVQDMGQNDPVTPAQACAIIAEVIRANSDQCKTKRWEIQLAGIHPELKPRVDKAEGNDMAGDALCIPPERTMHAGDTPADHKAMQAARWALVPSNGDLPRSDELVKTILDRVGHHKTDSIPARIAHKLLGEPSILWRGRRRGL